MKKFVCRAVRKLYVQSVIDAACGKGKRLCYKKLAVLFAAVLFFAFASVAATYAAEAKFPKRPINLYIPYPPGGFIDLTCRALGEAAGKVLGQPLIPINRPGASGTLAATMLKTMEPDGYNIAVSAGSIFYLPAQEDVSFDPLKDFTYICRTTDSSIGILVRSDSPWKTLKEFLTYAKANPGKIKYGTASPRGPLGMAMADLGIKEGIRWNVVPFSGGNEAVAALLGKHVNAICQGPEYIPHVESGELRLLALIGDQRFKRFPNVPTFKELGYVPHLVATGIIGPAGLPKDVIDKLDDAFKKALADPKVQKVMDDTGSPTVYQNSQQYTAWARTAVAAYADLVKRVGLAKK